MARTTTEELKKNRLAAMTADERAVFDEIYGAGRLALNVGEKVRGAPRPPPAAGRPTSRNSRHRRR